MVCVCRPLHTPAHLLRHHLRRRQPLSLGGTMFLSRHDMRLAYTYCDPRVQLLIGYDPSELLGRTVYQFHNPLDAHKCSECHNSLIKTGSGVSGYYRYLGKTGVWVWMQTRATIVSDTRGHPQYVVCNNFIISQKEGERCLQMEQQLQQQQGASPSQQGLLSSELLAKGALDLPALAQATSPVSVTDSEHEQHDDTGYSSAVSSLGSATTSPCPLTGMGGGVDLDPCLLSTHKQLAFHHQEMPKDKDSDELEVSFVQGLESAPELGFHSTLSSAIYGEFGVQELAHPMDSLAGADDGAEDMADDFGLNPLPAVSDQTSDPFLCEVGGSGRGRGEGSLTHVMEDMEVLDNLLQDIGRECESSHDAVFPASPLSQTSNPQGEAGYANGGEAPTGGSLDSAGSLVFRSLVSGPSLCDRSPQERPPEEPSLLTTGMDSVRPPSLLRTLLDKEGEAVKMCPPVIEAWTKSLPSVSLSSDKAAIGPVTSRKGQTASTDRTCTAEESASVERGQSGVGEGGGKRPSPGVSGVGQQLMVCGGKQVLVPRQVDLTEDHSDEEGEGLGSYDEDVDVQSILPEDLMDFAMQYCDPAGNRDDVQTDILAEVEAHVWDSVDQLMGADTSDAPSLSSPQPQVRSGKDAMGKVVSISCKEVSQEVPEKGYYGKPTEPEAVGATLTQRPVRTPASSSAASCVIQSDVISSTLQELQPAITIITSSGKTSRKTPPAGKDRTVAIVKQCNLSASAQTKCCSAISPALSDHKYSTTRTLSPSPGAHPPGGKRMRTHWDKSDGPRERQGSEGESGCAHSTDSSPPPSRGAEPTSKVHAAARAGASPKCGGVGSLPKSVSQGSKPSPQPPSQPTSPAPAPIPVNGGGKPLTAMSELEKHLRGLVAPPDERKKDSEDLLSPLEGSSRVGSKPFLELLLTGEISHERYRQIDYHLLYQERERRLEENGQSS